MLQYLTTNLHDAHYPPIRASSAARRRSARARYGLRSAAARNRTSRTRRRRACCRRPRRAPTGAIYQTGQQMELFADLKARRVGDVLTIALERVDRGQQERGHQDDQDDRRSPTRDPRMFGKTITTKGVPILNTTLNGADAFDGEGPSAQSNSLGGQPDRDRGRRAGKRQPGRAGRQDPAA